MKTSKLTLSVLFALTLAACGGDDGEDGLDGADGATGTDGTDGVSSFVTRTDVVTTNANIAYAAYSDSLISAVAMREVLASWLPLLQKKPLPQPKKLG